MSIPVEQVSRHALNIAAAAAPPKRRRPSPAENAVAKVEAANLRPAHSEKRADDWRISHSENVAAARAGDRRSQAPPPLPRPVAWTVNDGARLLSISRATVYLLARTGKLKLIRVAGRTLIPDSEILRLGSEGA
jgi:hypothetical protein